MFKDYLEEQGYIDVKSPRQTLKKSFEIELIENGHQWLQLLTDRNLIAHTYDEETAKKVDKLIAEIYYPLFKQLHNRFLALEKND